MNRAFGGLFFAGCVLLLARGVADAQSVPVDHFPGLQFDAPVPARVLSGAPVPLSGVVHADAGQLAVHLGAHR